MNAGKSTTLLQSSYNYRERNMNTMVYTAAIDDRFGVGKVTSRIGIHEEANLFTSTSDLFAEVSQRLQQEEIHCVLVDEAQFLTKQQVYQLSDVVDKLKIQCFAMACVPTSKQSYLKAVSIYLLGQIN